MGKIVLLDNDTINKIAAGEVIERPASAIKEIMENSIDAGATQITVEIRNGGISYIRVTDNGKGIMQDDMEIAFERHATSKLRNAEELEYVNTMGFRGEALASIAAIAKVSLLSKTADENNGYEVVIEGGKILKKEEAACPNGTIITIENLFYNTPVRYKFLRKDFTEAGYIEDAVTRIALIHPEIAIKLINSGRTVIQTPGNGDIRSVIYNIYGKEIAENLINIEYQYEDMYVKGVIGKPEISRSNRSNQLFYVNKRFVKDKTLSSAAEQAFKDIIASGRHGFLILDLEMDSKKVDVNVHPAKLEVRFQEENQVFKAIYHAIKEGLKGETKSSNSVNTQFDFINKENYNPYSEPKTMETTKQIEKIDKIISTPTQNIETTNLNDTQKQSNQTIQDIEKKSEEAFENILERIKKMNETLRNSKEQNIQKINEENENIEKEETIKQENEINTATIQEEKTAENSEEYEEKNESQKINNNNIVENSTATQNDSKIDSKFLEMYERNFGLAVKKQENTDKTDISNEFKPVTTEKNISLFENVSQYATKPIYKYIGIAFDSYIVVEMNENLYIINWQEANAKIIYKKMKEEYYSNNGEKNSQLMLLPDIITLDYKKMGIYRDNVEMLRKAGFMVEEFGENTVKLSGVPELIIDLETKDIFIEILDSINTVARTDKAGIEEKFIQTIAKNVAKQDKKKLETPEIIKLLDSLFVLPNPFTGIDGNAVAMKLTKYDIEKKFSRIQ